MSFRRNPAYLGSVRQRLAQRLMVGAAIVRDQARALVEQEGSGVQYPGSPHRSSAPGAPPASQSGALADSLRVYGPRHAPEAVEAAAGTDLYRAVFLEMGTAHAAPRPFLLPALLGSKAQVLRAMTGEPGHG